MGHETDGGRQRQDGAASDGNLEEHGHPFPLILLDGQMPEMDGFTLAEVIHGDPELVGATRWV